MAHYGGDKQPSGDSSAYWEQSIATARHGDQEALGEIFQRVRSYLGVLAKEKMDGPLQVKESPSDIVQETLLQAKRGFERFRGSSRVEFIVWLRGILDHCVQTTKRKYRGTEKRDLAREVTLNAGDEFPVEFAGTISPASTPSGHAIASEESARLQRALRELPPRYEKVVRLRNELSLSFREVGAVLNCSEDAAQKLWARAIDRLTQMLS